MQGKLADARGAGQTSLAVGAQDEKIGPTQLVADGHEGLFSTISMAILGDTVWDAARTRWTVALIIALSRSLSLIWAERQHRRLTRVKEPVEGNPHCSPL